MAPLSLINRLQLSLAIMVIAGLAVGFLFRGLNETFTGFRDVWLMNPLSEKQFLFRSIYIFSGICIAAISFLMALTQLFTPKKGNAQKLLGLSLFLLIFMIGWRAFPYFAYRLHDVFGNGNSSQYDPKAMLPMIYIGEIWRMGVLITQLGSWIFTLMVFIRQIILFGKAKYNFTEFLLMGITLLQAASVLITPGYYNWLMD